MFYPINIPFASGISVLWYRFIFTLLITLGFFSCTTQTAEPEYIGKEYFPLEKGMWLVYDVDSTVYDDFLGMVFHYQYQVKKINAGFFESDSEGKIMRLERYYRANEAQPWEIKNVGTQRIKNMRAIKTLDNVSYVKLAFPLRLNKSWNGNAFNIHPAQSYRITDIHQPRTIGNQFFDSTLRVLQRDFSTLISEELEYEIYGSGIGLLQRHFTKLHKEIDGTIIRGTIYIYTINDYGKIEILQ